MADQIKHRGPDSDGYYTNEDVALGFRRLSIIDLAGGDQPIYNEDKTKLVFMNGEIYNYKSIKEDLLLKLRGMFAFVIYDINTHELFGARDFYGIKPLYYYLDDEEFMFGSEIKSFLAHPNFKKELNRDMLEVKL